MLYSQVRHIAFAHYPKTAGCTLFQWFTAGFPDAVHVDPNNPHMDVRRGLKRLATAAGTETRSGSVRLLRPFDWLHPRTSRLRGLRVIGVLREPFEMLVSLYEFWRKTPSHIEVPPFIDVARSGTFRDFLWMAVVEKEMPRYEDFFDVGGPAWADTRLIDFHGLETGLAAVCAEFGIGQAVRLERINAGGGRRRSLEEYRAEAATLCLNVRGYFRWYYAHGARLAIRGGERRIAA